ncbi:serine hydrolase [Aquimarina sp. 2-A2]|uniref:serine hydrolase n=1 Tax=Aquimarina sp. 2-A2 TaxID=3382644 RepID=UPI00387EF3B7
MKNVFFNTLLYLMIFVSACSDKKEEQKKQSIQITKNTINTYIKKVIANHEIPGLALAVIQDNEVIYEEYFGKSSIEEDIPVTATSIFPLYSTSKLITNVAVFQLIEQGKLKLDDSISTYLEDLPEQWRKIQVKHLVTHSSGLPNYIKYESTLSDSELMEKLVQDPIEFTQGNQFSYNQTNYWLVSQIIEKITGMSYEQFVIENQFEDNKEGLVFSSNTNDEYIDKVTGYVYDRKKAAFIIPKYVNNERAHSANGINLTLSNLMEWNARIDRNQLLKPATKFDMWTPFNFKNGKDTFLHGWSTSNVNQIVSYGFSGGNIAAFRKFPNQNTTILLVTNGYKIPAYDLIVNDISRIVIPQLKKQNFELEEDIIELVLTNKYEEALKSSEKLKIENPNSDLYSLKSSINTIGNLVSEKKEFEKAVKIFKIIPKIDPTWWISYAGIAESYDALNDSPNALKHYQKAIELNPNNEYGYNDVMAKRIKILSNYE